VNNIGEITFEIKGNIGNIALTPDNYDVFNLPQIVEDVKNMLFPNGRGKESPIVTYEMREGSVKHVFKTRIQKVMEFSAVLSMISANKSLEGLIPNTAKAFEDIQQISRKQGFTFDIFTSANPKLSVKIAPETNYVQTAQPWVDAEFYFYGKLVDAGGKDKANIHLLTEDYGMLRISVEKNYLRDIEGNPLYRNFAVRVRGKQNMYDGKINTSSLSLIDIVDYDNKYNEEYLDSLIKKATPHLKKIDADEWINEMRREECYA